MSIPVVSERVGKRTSSGGAKSSLAGVVRVLKSSDSCWASLEIISSSDGSVYTLLFSLAGFRLTPAPGDSISG